AELRDDLPPGLVRVVCRMMAKDPAQRYQTPGEVVAALLPFRRPAPALADPARGDGTEVSRSQEAPPRSPSEKRGKAASRSREERAARKTPAPAPARPRRRVGRRRTRFPWPLAIAAAVALVGAISVAGGLLVRSLLRPTPAQGDATEDGQVMVFCRD